MGLISYALSETSIVFRVKILNSSVTTGAGLEGLLFSSSGLIIGTIADNESGTTTYTEAAGNIETVVALGSYSPPTTNKCRFREVDATNHKGVYEIHLADARFAISSSKSLLVSIAGASNVAQTDVVIPLTTTDPYAADFGLALDNTNLAHVDASEKIALLAATQTSIDAIETKSDFLPAVTAGGVGGVFIAGTNAATTVTTSFTTTFTGDLTGNVDGTLATTTTNTDLATLTSGMTSLTEWLGAMAGLQAENGTAQSEIRATGAGSGSFDATADSLEAIKNNSAWDTATGFSTHAATDIVSTGAITTSGGAVTTVTTVTTVGTNTDMRGTDSAALATNVPDSLSHANLQTQLITTYGLDHLIAAAVIGADVTDNSIFAKLVSKEATADWDDFANTTESLQALKDLGDVNWVTGNTTTPLTAAGIRSAVGMSSANLDTQIGDIPTVSEFNGRTLVAAGYFVGATDTVANVTTVGSVMTKTGYELAAAEDVYHADVDLRIDVTNTQDEYTVTWFKNGVRITSGITVPTIQVVKRVDGTDLIASTAMTQIGSTGSYKYDEATNRTTAGEASVAIVAATIDGGGRTFARVVGRDSS